MSLWDQISEVARENDVLRHPFYVRWTEGQLSWGELANYSSQYRHAVIALAEASVRAARSPQAGDDTVDLVGHAWEEVAHIAVWDQFLQQVGGKIGAEATSETRKCVAAWRGADARPLLETLVGLYAIESAQPSVSAVKARALDKHYGIPFVSYFELHRRRDVAHAAELRAQVDRRLDPGGDIPSLVQTAVLVLAANWHLLDGVERSGGPGTTDGTSKRSGR
jgi:pyrroloquinoline-quinone synthase